MARNFRESSFRRRAELAEDVNPAAYIVNLADCMLVLACGFMVAMMVLWNIPANVEELAGESLEEVNPESILENIQGGGSFYIEAGTVYQDPNTGQLWMVRKDEAGDSVGEDDYEQSDIIENSSGNTPSRALGAD